MGERRERGRHDGIRTAADVMAAVRARGWTDPLWAEVGRLRLEADAVRIFRAFDGEEEEGGASLRFPGDVLRWLMDLTPYPVPANRPAV